MVNQLYEPATWDGHVCEPGEKHYHLYPWQEGTYERWFCTRCRVVEWAIRIHGEIVHSTREELEVTGWVQPYNPDGGVRIVTKLASGGPT